MNTEEEIKELLHQIEKLGAPGADGLISVKFGKLFDATQDIFEALVGTLRSAKKKKLIRFEGEMLLKGAHDNVDIVLLQPQQQQ